MKVVEVETLKNYKIFIGNDLIFKLKELLELSNLNGKLLIITDENIYKIYGSKFFKYFHEYEYALHVVKPGEENKNIEEAKIIYEKMIARNLDRNTLIVALGGGMVGDLAGFVSATYMRGIKYIQIPTTLLAQVDSSVGGKVAVNFGGYKNLIGSFYQPDMVLMDTNFLKTLSREEFISGVGEIIKYGFIQDYILLEYIEDNISDMTNYNNTVIEKIILSSVKIKKNIVEIDENESSTRMLLNFGHTIGHGIESLNEFKKYKHGISVMIGMFYESKLAFNRGLISREFMNEIEKIISKFIDIPIFTNSEINEILEKLKKDKKNKNGRPVVILPQGKGKVKVFYDVEYSDIKKR